MLDYPRTPKALAAAISIWINDLEKEGTRNVLEGKRKGAPECNLLRPVD
jgi:hypothetical protein